MSDGRASAGRGPSHRAVEMVVAAIVVAIGAVVMWDSARIGAGWATEGPQAGYFPFYIGLLIVASSLVTFVQAAVAGERRTLLTAAQAKPVAAVLLPSLAYVALIGPLGIYVASAGYIAWFMWWIGGYRNLLVPAVALGVPLLCFVVFELWFMVPLPKGPLEAALGF